jgi:hypothetical protein
MSASSVVAGQKPSSAAVFIETGQSSRDRFLASGQQTVVNGEVVGIYLFRCDERKESTLSG